MQGKTADVIGRKSAAPNGLICAASDLIGFENTAAQIGGSWSQMLNDDGFKSLRHPKARGSPIPAM
jgi:hypothetical protein